MQPLLSVESLCKRYASPRGGPEGAVTAVGDVSFSIAQGATLALVGESGSGKSTLAMCLACLERPTSGRVMFEGRELTALPESELRRTRPKIQLVFQDPATSLNPRFTAGEIVTEPLTVHTRLAQRERARRAAELLARVGLSHDLAGRPPGALSGGQKQRLAIARALALEPKLVIFDEALSALDCSVQAQIANLLLDLQASLSLTYLFITHDLAMAAQMAGEIAVMDSGRIVEHGRTEAVLARPEHAATRTLLAATLPFSFPPTGPAPAGTVR